MSTKSIAAWAGAVRPILGLTTALVAATTGTLSAVGIELKGIPVLSALPTWAVAVILGLVMTIALAMLISSYRNFSQASRIENSDAFTSSLDRPGALIGRENDISGLLSAVRRHLIVFVDGESGCGKSAIISAGLQPALSVHEDQGILPVVVRDWGEHWVRGPICATLEATYSALSNSEKERLDWLVAPDLIPETIALSEELDLRLTQIQNQLRLTPLIIADQFDDYQSRHANAFVDAEGNWIDADTLIATNAFWTTISRRLSQNGVHLLVIVRSDALAGLKSIRFLPDTSIAARTIKRLNASLTRDILQNVTTSCGKEIVSNPENGWNDLRDRIAYDISSSGSLLIEQLRTVLRGLVNIPTLTVRSYKRVGGIKGLEMLYVRNAISASRADGADADPATARRLLMAIIDTGNGGHLIRGRCARSHDLAQIAGGQDKAERIFSVLEAHGIARRVNLNEGNHGWRLDHDYLAQAVLKECELAKRWSDRLNRENEKYCAASSPIERLSSLLSIRDFSQIALAKIKGDLILGDSRRFFLASATKPIAIFLTAILASSMYAKARSVSHEIQETQVLSERLSSTNERTTGELQSWWEPESVRGRIIALASEDNMRLRRLLSTHWPLAMAGVDDKDIHTLAKIFASSDSNLDDASKISMYDQLALRSDDTLLVEDAAKRTRPVLADSTELFSTYAQLISRVRPSSLQSEARELRSENEQDDAAMPEMNGDESSAIDQDAGFDEQIDLPYELSDIESIRREAYRLVVTRMSPGDALKELASLRDSMLDSPSSFAIDGYAIVGGILTNSRSYATDLRLQQSVNDEISAGIVTIGSLQSNAFRDHAAVALARLILATRNASAARAYLPSLKAQITKDESGEIDSPGAAYAYGVLGAAIGDQGAIKYSLGTIRRFSNRGSFRGTYAFVCGAIIDRTIAEEEVTDLLSEAEATPIDALQVLLTKVSYEKRLDLAEDLRKRRTKAPSSLNLARAYLAVTTSLNTSDITRELRTFRDGATARFADQMVLASLGVQTNDNVSRDLGLQGMRSYLVKHPLKDAQIVIYGGYLWTSSTEGERIAAFNDLLPLLRRAKTETLPSTMVSISTLIGRQGEAFDAIDTLLASKTSRTRSPLVRAYATLAGLSNRPDAIHRASTTLTRLLNKNADGDESVTDAYAIIAGYAVARGRKDPGVVRAILTAAGHPYALNAAPLVAALEKIAGREFSGSAVRAAAWAETSLKIKPETLRPANCPASEPLCPSDYRLDVPSPEEAPGSNSQVATGGWH